MRARAPLVAVALVLAACGGDEGLTMDEERAFAAAPTNAALPDGWELTEARPSEPGDPLPDIDGCEQLAAMDVSGAEAFITASIDAPAADLPLLDLDLDVIVMPGSASAAAYVAAVADPATSACLVELDAGSSEIQVVEALAPALVGGEAARLRFDFPSTDDEAAATLELVAIASADLLAVVEVAYATEVPPPGLDAVLASIADRLAGAS